jgi:hypothetical protein
MASSTQGRYSPNAAIANVVTDTVDATYGTQEANVIADLRTKLNLALAALRVAGIIAE